MISVLLVDDEPSLLEMTRIFLEQDGEFSVDTVLSGSDALKKIAGSQYDVIVSDFEMPGMDGIELLRQTKALGCETPFIIFTAKRREYVVIEALNYGADFYLQKGGDAEVQYAELGNMVKQAVQRKRAEDSLRESERRYRDIVEDQTEFICRFRPDGTHVFVNEAYCRYFGKTRDELIGQRFLQQVPAEDRGKIGSHLASLTPESPSASIEHRIVMPGGEVRWQRWVDRAIFDQEGRVIEYQSVGRDISDHKAGEEALRRSERRLSDIIDFLPDATFAIDSEGKVIAWNQAIEEMTGVLAKDMLGKGDYAYAVPFYGNPRPVLIDLIFSPDQDILDHYYTSVRRGGPAVMAETCLPSPKGRKGVVLWAIATPFFDEKGEITGAIESIRDITDLRNAQSRAEVNEEKLQEILEFLPVTVFECDREGNIDYANSIGFSCFGYAREDLEKGVNILSLISCDEWVRAAKNATWVLLGAQSYSVDYTGVRKDGSRFPITVFTSPIVDRRTREVTGFRGVVIDNTERKEMEDRFKALVENVNDCIWEMDADGVITYCSPKVFDILGIPPSALEGKRPMEVPLSEESSRMRERFLNVIAEKKSFAHFEWSTTHKDGHRLTLESSGAPVFSAAGSLKGYRGIFRDITEQKKEEEALLQANRKLRLLSSVTRHDILNQLTVLHGYLELSGDLVTDPVLAGYIEHEIKAANAIREQILFTRDYQEIGVHAPQWQDVAGVWRQAIALVGSSSRVSADPSTTLPAFTTEVTCEGLSIYADPLLEKVFFNLIDNTRKHGGHVTKIRLSCTVSPSGLTIICEDDGTGIPALEKERIFERGFGKDTGLGLFLSREILSITGFSIKETGEEGKGARFEILVPQGSFRNSGMYD